MKCKTMENYYKKYLEINRGSWYNSNYKNLDINVKRRKGMKDTIYSREQYLRKNGSRKMNH